MKKKIVRRQVADNTRAHILKAAQKHFSEFGFSGTTTQAIAKTAKVNETLISIILVTKHSYGKKLKKLLLTALLLSL